MENEINNSDYFFNLEKFNLQNSWRQHHRSVLGYCSIIAIIIEILVEIGLIISGNLTETYINYTKKFVLIPLVLYIILNVVVEICISIKNIPSTVKNYIICFGFSILCLIICYLHDIFIGVYATGMLAVFLSEIYCNKKLTIATTIFVIIGETIIGLFGNFDFETKRNFYYIGSIFIFDVLLGLSARVSILIIEWEEKRLKSVSQYQQQNQELIQEAFLDPLTGLKNRRALRKHIDEATKPLTYAIADIDKFKTVNDTWGHLEGDKILTDFSSIIKLNQNENLNVFRYGGDEFLFVFTDYTIAQISEICNSIKKDFSSMLSKEIKNSGCGISFGIASYKSEEKVKESLSRADEALYKAKTTKKVEIL